MFAPDVIALVALVVSALAMSFSGYTVFRVRFLIRTVAASLHVPKSLLPVVPPPSEMVVKAVDEQERREKNHHLPYRIDERILAIQQRLSRTLGAKAFEEVSRAAVLEELKKRDWTK